MPFGSDPTSWDCTFASPDPNVRSDPSVPRFEIARGKACVALGVGKTGEAFGATNRDGPVLLGSIPEATGGRTVPVAGRLSMLNSDAVGVSGECSKADEGLAVAGIEVSRLRAGVS